MLANIFRLLLRRADPPPADWLTQALALRERRQHDKAIALCRGVLAARPRNADAAQFLAAELLAAGRKQEALAAWQHAALLAPDDSNVQFTLGNVAAMLGDFELALTAFQRATALAPAEPAAWLAHGQLLKLLNRLDAAEACCRDGLAANPGHLELLTLHSAVLFEQGRLDEAMALIRTVITAAPDNARAHSDLLRMLNYADGQDADAVAAAHRDWNRQHAAALSAAAPTHANTREPQRRLRVGFVSPYFRKHAVSFFLEPVIEHHDAGAVEIHLYADVARPDETSQRLRAAGAIWHDCTALSDEALAAQIRRDAIDILVDLSGQTPGNRLLAFARKPAPLQITWNGYPNTTGLSAIDYRLTDACCDPPGGTEALHSETLVRLPHCYLVWRTPDDAPPLVPPPALTRGHITFGSVNSCYKLTPSLIALWAQLLQRVSTARLQLWTIDGEAARRRIAGLFAAQGIAKERLSFHGRVSHDEFLRAHQELDIALDSFPYHGTTTTCFSLWMGTPVVTLAGQVHASRVGVSLLTHAGMPELIAQTPAQYIEIAAGLAADLPALARRRAGLREHLRRQPLTDGPAGARDVEQTLRRLWQDYCANKVSAA